MILLYPSQQMVLKATSPDLRITIVNIVDYVKKRGQIISAGTSIMFPNNNTFGIYAQDDIWGMVAKGSRVLGWRRGYGSIIGLDGAATSRRSSRWVRVILFDGCTKIVFTAAPRRVPSLRSG